MEFNIRRLLEIPELKEEIVIIEPVESKKYFDWLLNNFNFPYGQIDWETVTDSKTISIDGMPDDDITDILKELINPDRSFVGIWSDIDRGIKLKGKTVIKHPGALWYPVKEDLWLISDDHKTVIEFHHESYLGYTTSFTENHPLIK